MSKPSSLREQVYHFISAEMQNGSLTPGSAIDMNAISKKLAVSKTPLRDALIQLESEGFVTIRPRRGIIVNELTLDEIKNFYEILGALESSVLATVFSKIKARHIERMEHLNTLQRQALDSAAGERYYQLNLEFHDIFLDLSANNLIKKTLTSLKRRLYDFPKRDYIRQWELINLDEHDRLVTSIKKGNRAGAVAIIKNEHWSFAIHRRYLKKFYNL
jgi:DNA-binding GntR family transcriptional regulator